MGLTVIVTLSLIVVLLLRWQYNTTNMSREYDVIGFWTERKHQIIKKYALAYSRIMTKKGFHHIYIDAHAGMGVHYSETSKSLVSGSPQIGLETNPPFKEYYFIDSDIDKVNILKRIVKDSPNVHVYHGDSNEILLRDIFPIIKRKGRCRGLCILDPYRINDLKWDVIKTAGEMKIIDAFLNFPIYDINRNVLRRDRSTVSQESISKMNSFWGGDTWEQEAFSSQGNMFGYETKVDNQTFAMIFQKRLECVAGFKYVSKPLPMKNSMNSPVYYLLLASQHDVADRIISYIFKQY